MFESGITRRSNENSEDGDNVGAPVRATDPDEGDDLSYTITGGADMGSFEIGRQQEFRPDHGQEGHGSWTIEGSKTDLHGRGDRHATRSASSDSTMVTIMVTNDNEMPEIDAARRPLQDGPEGTATP